MDYKYKISISVFLEDRTPLSRAAEKGNEIVVKLLLENGARPDFEDIDGQTPLSRAVEKGSVAVVQLLLAKEAKMDYKYTIFDSVLKRTPLSRAAEKGNEGVVRLLLEYGAQPDLEDGDGRTPLSRAVRARQTVVADLLRLYCTP